MSIVQAIQSVYGNYQVFYLMLLVVANVALGVIASAKRGDFSLGELPTFLHSRVAQLLIGYGAAAVVAIAQPALAQAPDVAFVALTAWLVKHIWDNLADLGLGDLVKAPTGT